VEVFMSKIEWRRPWGLGLLALTLTLYACGGGGGGDGDTPAADTTPPTVTGFVVPGTAAALTVPITSFTATDDVAVTGYLVNESATAPSASDPGWANAVPADYAFASEGSKTLYAWAKDAAGNVSASRSASVVVALTPPADTTPPVVSATPAGQVFEDGPQSISLAATDDSDPSPRIFYTTDGTFPTDQSALYTGPIDVSTNTVLRFFAMDASGNESAGSVEGYVVFAVCDNPDDLLDPASDCSKRRQAEQEWVLSGHGNILDDPFRHWDGDLAVTDSCARCHTWQGFFDFALDGFAESDAPQPVGLDCLACHESGSFATLYDDYVGNFTALEPVRFRSGENASLRGPSNLCMACHQGRSSTDSVNNTIDNSPTAGPYDFINVHNFAAAASYFGGEVRGGYQYDGMEYEGRNTFPSHPDDRKTCVGCHMRGAAKDHTFRPQLADCTGCHGGTSFETLGGSPGANFVAIQTLLGELLSEIQGYAAGTIGTAIAYDAAKAPYFFVDANANGTVDAAETRNYDLFDDKLLRAAYNYQMGQKEPCGFIHNGTYVQQILFDSVVDLGGTPSVTAPQRAGFDAAASSKTQQWQFSGHAHTAAPAFTHWSNEQENFEVPAECSRCHTTPGFIAFAEGMAPDAVPVGSVVECRVCHQQENLFGDPTTRYDAQVASGNGPLVEVAFESGATLTLDDDSNMCASCHQGMASGNIVDQTPANAVVQSPVDYVSYDFSGDRHFFAAAAILFGHDSFAGYEYAGQTYRGQNPYAGHVPGGAGEGKNTCFACHLRGVGDHRFRPQLPDCTASGCHAGIGSFEELGGGNDAVSPGVDYDGDGVIESFQGEIDGLQGLLLVTMQTYATRVSGPSRLPSPSSIAYSPGVFPYFFRDLDQDGIASDAEAVPGNEYRDFDVNLLRAAFNFHSNNDPCGDMHNYVYVVQTTYDSIDVLDDGDLNGSVRAFGSAPAVRP
jgi:hypothetical protein